MGLALTREGLPVRTWVFPGNTVDATTVARVKDDLRGWKLGRAIFVGDAGMDSEANRVELSKGLGHALLIERAAEIRTGDTWRTLRLALDELKAVRYQVQGTAIVQRTRPTPAAAAILKKPTISPPLRVLAVEQPPADTSTP